MVVDSPSMMDAMATSPPSALYSPVRTKRLDDKGARLGALMDRGRKTEEWHPLWRPRACRGCRSPFGTAMAIKNEMETWRQPPAGMDLIRHPREGLTPLHRARRMSRMWHFSAPPWRRHGTSKTSSSIRPRRSATPPAPMPTVPTTPRRQRRRHPPPTPLLWWLRHTGRVPERVGRHRRNGAEGRAAAEPRRWR